MSKNNNVWITENAIYSTHYLIDKRSEDYSFNLNSSKIIFVNAKLNDQMKSLKSSKTNYFRKSLNYNKLIKLRSADELIFTEIYPDIDLRVYFDGSEIRFDYLLDEFADPSQIKLNFSEKIKSRSNNKINFDTWALKDLKTFYNQNGENINSSFRVSGNDLSIELGDYDRSQKITIDPVIYSSYLGGLDIDSGEDIIIDKNGNTIIVGETMSVNFPTSLGSYQRFFSAVNDSNNIPSEIFVTKVDNNFNEVFTTYIGGDRIDVAKGVEIDDDGNINLIGYSNSENFPTTQAAYDTTFNGGMDVVVVKLNPSGDSLIYSTYIGGASDDFGIDLSLTEDNSAVLTGYTNQDPSGENVFPVTVGSFHIENVGQIDGFVSMLSPSGRDIIWSSFIGGLQDDFPQAVKLGPDSSLFITGRTRSEAYPTTDGVLYRFYNDQNTSPFHSDAFLSKISLDGREIIWSSIFGGRTGDIGYGLEILSDTSVVVVGETRSSDFILSDDALYTSLNKQNQSSLNSDGFIVHFNKNADSLRFATFFGGNQGDRAIDIVADSFDDIYLTGITNSNDFPITSNAIDRTFNDSLNFSDIFISKVDLSVPSLEYSTFFGGERSDIGKSIDLRFRNRVIVAGNTSSTFFETTLDAIQVAYQDSLKSDAHFFEIYIENFDDSDTVICEGNSVMLDSDFSSSSFSLSYYWSPEESLNDPTLEFPTATPEISTQYTCVITNQNGESFLAEYIVGVATQIESQVTGPSRVQNLIQYTYEAKATPTNFYEWEIFGGVIINGEDTPIIDVVWQKAETGQLLLIERSIYGCADTTNIAVNFEPPLDFDDYIFDSYEFCEGDTILLDAGEQYRSVRWQDGVYSRYDTVYKDGEYYFTALDLNDQFYQSPVEIIEFSKAPLRPNIVYSEEDNLFTCISAAQQYRWYKDDILLVTEKTRFLTPDESACYKVEIAYITDCFSESDSLCVDVANVEYSSISIFPNPSYDYVQINGLDNLIGKQLKILDLYGNEIYKTKVLVSEVRVDLSNYPKSMYFLELDDRILKKIVKY